MPWEDGFAFLKSLSDIQFEIVFVTAHDTFGIQAAKFSAIDYLLKPVLIPDLIEAVKKATRRIEQKKENISLKGLLQYLNNANKAEQKIALPLMNETRLVEVNNIIRVESKNVYSYFFIQNEERLVISKPLKFYEELLSEYGFIRIHQTHLVNKAYIKGILTKEGLFVILKDNTQIPVARQRKEAVKKFLLE
jgi:two-component system LytT family response regulator